MLLQIALYTSLALSLQKPLESNNFKERDKARHCLMSLSPTYCFMGVLALGQQPNAEMQQAIRTVVYNWEVQYAKQMVAEFEIWFREVMDSKEGDKPWRKVEQMEKSKANPLLWAALVGPLLEVRCHQIFGGDCKNGCFSLLESEEVADFVYNIFKKKLGLEAGDCLEW